MSITGINVYNVKSIDEYWLMLETDLRHLMSSFLKSRHEYGTSNMCSEYGIQLSLVNYARKIAEKQKIDVNKTICICMAVGLCFPEYGSYGMLACEKYVIEKNISLNRNEIKIGAIELCISDFGGIITPQLEEALYAYYENRTDIPEVNVARYCQIKIKESRCLMKKGVFSGEAIKMIMDRAEKSFSVEQSIMENDDTDIDIPNEVLEDVNASLDSFIKWDGLPLGVFRYVI